MPACRTLQSSDQGMMLGWTIVSAGDVNGDGLLDLVAGAPGLVDRGRRAGGAVLFTGTGQGLNFAPASTNAGQWRHGRFGETICAGDDFSGDGIPDVMLGVPRVGISRTNELRVLLYAGAGGKFAVTPFRSFRFRAPQGRPEARICPVGDVNGDHFKDVIVSAPPLASERGAAWVLYGSSTGLVTGAIWISHDSGGEAMLGGFIEGAGDVNGDGFGDVVVGAPLFDTSEKNAGRACLYLGSKGGLSTRPAWVTVGQEADDRFGGAVAGLGDMNGDGFDDVGIGAPGRDREQPGTGKAFIFLGSTNGLQKTPATVLSGESVGGGFGRYIGGPGDVDGDGLADLLISATEHSHMAKYEGRVYLYLGSKDGAEPIPRMIVDGGSPHSRFGRALARAGDMNRDGLADFCIGSPHFRDGDSATGGRLDLFYGSRESYSRPIHLVARSHRFELFDPAGSTHVDQQALANAASLVNLGAVRASPPVWWPWSLSAAILTACAGLVLLVWRRRTVAIERERARIARDLHDDLGASLTRISLASASANPASTDGTARTVAEDARRAMMAMREIVWSVDPANDTLEKLATFLGQKAQEMFANTEVRCFTDIAINLPARKIPADVRQNLFLAVKEALHNSLRHARAEKIWLRLRFEDPELQIVIEDDGRGIAPVGQGNGNGMRNMKARMKEIGGTLTIKPRSGGGTLVCMHTKL